MKAAIYDPYLDTLGGGERYCLTVAEILLKNGWQVDLFWSGSKDLVSRAEKRFSLQLKKLTLVPDVFGLRARKLDLLESRQQIESLISQPHPPSQNVIQKTKKFIRNYRITRNYNLFFYLSDGSVPFLFAKNNILHVQVPFNITPTTGHKIINTIKFRIGQTKIICNSQFTKKFTKKLFRQPSAVLYPPVDIEKFNPGSNKKNHILSVGRFDNILNAKKQDILISAFQDIHRHHPEWKLILAGGSIQNPNQNSFLKHLKFISKDLPVEFIVNPPFTDLQKLFTTAKIYWHAAGYKIDQEAHPETAEHFGITVVEAMASGLVPIVVNKGGLPEIITEGKNGFLWSDINQLVDKTQLLISQPKKLIGMSRQSLIDCQKFSKNNFQKQLLDLTNN